MYIIFTRNKDLYNTNMSYYNLCGIGSQHSNISKGKRGGGGGGGGGGGYIKCMHIMLLCIIIYSEP